MQRRWRRVVADGEPDQPDQRPDVHRARQHDAERERRLHQHRIGHVHCQRLRLHLGQRHRYGDDERRRRRSRRRPVHGREYLQEPRLRQRGEGAGGGRWQQPGRGGGRQLPDRYLDGPHRGDHRRQHPHGPAGSAGQRGNTGPGHHATGVRGRDLRPAGPRLRSPRVQRRDSSHLCGLTQYETQYIDPITSILAMPKYSNLRIVAIIEPDSLPNVVTNQSQSACSTATPLYEQGITYAQNKQAITNVYNFIGIAHSAWLGWPSNMSATPGMYNTVVKATTAGYASIDGFISDTANYTPTQEPLLTNPTLSIGGQPVDSATFYQFNPTFDELNYDTQMYNTLVSAGFPASKKFLIDTSRHGWGPTHPTTITQTSDVNSYVAANKIDKRPFRGDWCNQNNSGIGTRPADQPFGASSPIEAFVWIKPPGESDGDYPTATHTHGDPRCDPNGTNTDGNGGTYSTGSIPGSTCPLASGSRPSSRCWSRTPSPRSREQAPQNTRPAR